MSSILPTGSTGTSTGSTASGTSTGSSSGTSSLAGGTGLGTVSSTGLGSGLDINALVAQLVAAEGNGPTRLLNSRQSTLQAKVSAYGQFQAAVSALQASIATLATTAQFQVNAASVTDTNVATATATSDAATGSYALEVRQLANGAKLVSGPLAASTTVVGTGTLNINVGGATIAVSVDASNNTLAGIAAAISKAGAAQGVAASLLTANDGVRLVLTSATTGAANAVTVTQTGGDGGLASLGYDPTNNDNHLTQVLKPQDAIVKLDGFAYNSASNTVTGAISGVTINLKAASADGVTTPLTISSDQSSAQKAVSTFAQSYNSLMTAVGTLTSYNAATGVAGPLLGDSVLQGFVSQVNKVISSPGGVPRGGPFNTLAEIGIVANTDGTLGADSTRLNAAFTSNYASVAQLFAGPDGVATKLNTLLDQYTQPSGILSQQTKSLQQNLTDIGTQRTALNQRLSALQARLYAQYNAMDTLVAQLKNTGSSLLSQLNSVYYPGKSTTSTP